LGPLFFNVRHQGRPYANGQGQLRVRVQVIEGSNHVYQADTVPVQGRWTGLRQHDHAVDGGHKKDQRSAQFEGDGIINGATDPNGQNYKFMIWAGDGSPDTFRIKIWWEDSLGEHVVYDNGVQQAIAGGSIIVHTK
jgi:hypothetical protein